GTRAGSGAAREAKTSRALRERMQDCDGIGDHRLVRVRVAPGRARFAMSEQLADITERHLAGKARRGRVAKIVEANVVETGDVSRRRPDALLAEPGVLRQAE